MTERSIPNFSRNGDFSSIFNVKFERIAFWMWAITATKPFLIFLFFQKQTELGTAVGGFLSFFFILLITPHVIINGLPERTFYWPKLIKLITTYLLLTTLTLLWTEAKSIFVATAYDTILLSDILLAVLLMRLDYPSRIITKSLNGIVVGTTVLAIAVLFLSGLTSDNRLGNIDYLHPNVIGKQMALAGLCSVYLVLKSEDYLHKTVFWLTTSTILCCTLLLSLSKTSIIGFLTALPFLIFTRKSSKRKIIIFLSMLVIIGFLIYGRLSDYVDQYLYKTQNGQALETASGRALVWFETIIMIKRNPWFGHGVMAFRDAGPQVASERLVTAHNEFLHQWFSYGLLGPLFTVLIYAGFIALILKVKRLKTYQIETGLCTGLLVFYLIRGLFEAEAIGLVFPLPMLILMIFWLENLARTNNTGDSHEIEFNNY